MLSSKLKHIQDILKEIDMFEHQLKKVDAHIKVHKDEQQEMYPYINLANDVENLNRKKEGD